MAEITKDVVIKALSRLHHPERGQDIVSAGMVRGLVIRDGRVGFTLDIGASDPAAGEALRGQCEQAIRALAGVTDALIVATGEREAAPIPPPRPAATGPAGVKAIIAVASGKGGVGKSTVAVNLALALAAMGKSVGLLDADIYGPSVPRMLGLSGRPQSDGKQITPMVAHGIKAMSIGLLVDIDTPMIWRGPMATSALNQMLNDVAWGELDILVVDMPPGTGDIQLTLAQRAPLAGAVIVSTPQDIALIDARKGLAMFRKVNVPILGLVENMSQFICPHCGEASDIFGHGGARRTATELDTEFLGEIPLDITIRETSDSGAPVVAMAPRSPQAQAFFAVATKVAAALE